LKEGPCNAQVREKIEERAHALTAAKDALNYTSRRERGYWRLSGEQGLGPPRGGLA
jgi:hypothetical protein